MNKKIRTASTRVIYFLTAPTKMTLGTRLVEKMKKNVLPGPHACFEGFQHAEIFWVYRQYKAKMEMLPNGVGQFFLLAALLLFFYTYE